MDVFCLLVTPFPIKDLWRCQLQNNDSRTSSRLWYKLPTSFLWPRILFRVFKRRTKMWQLICRRRLKRENRDDKPEYFWQKIVSHSKVFLTWISSAAPMFPLELWKIFWTSKFLSTGFCQQSLAPKECGSCSLFPPRMALSNRTLHRLHFCIRPWVYLKQRLIHLFELIKKCLTSFFHPDSDGRIFSTFAK